MAGFNACVTRNVLAYFGSGSDVGKPITLKSGSASLRAAGSSAGACARAAVGASRAVPRTRVSRRFTLAPVRNASVARGADRNPPAQDHDLTVGEIRRTAVRHAIPDDASFAFQLLYEVAVVGIARNDAGRARLTGRRNVHDFVVSEVLNQGPP